MRPLRQLIPSLLWIAASVYLTGCTRAPEKQVILVTDVDKEVVGPILSAFYRAEQNSIQPDIRSTAAIESSSIVDGADVLWTSDLLALERLNQQGQLQPIRWSPDVLLSTRFSSTNQTWRAFAAAAMVIVVHSELTDQAKRSLDSLENLTQSQWRDRCGIAAPRRSPATLWALANMANSKPTLQADQWLQQVTENCRITQGERELLTLVDRGELDWGLVRSDLVAERLDRTARFEIIYPDQQAAQIGTFLIPHAVAVKADAEHPIAATRLANYLASAPTADRLAMGEPALIPLSRAATIRPRILNAQAIRWADVDYQSLHQSCARVLAAFQASTPVSALGE